MVELDIDLLGLRSASLPRLIEALVGVLDAPAAARAATSIAEIGVDETVRLVRSASMPELGAAGQALNQFLTGPRGAKLRTIAPGAHDRLAGLVPVIGAASSPAGKNAREMTLRSWDGRADDVLRALVEHDGRMERSELRSRLGVSESYLSHLLRDLEAARLVERTSQPGRRGVTVLLSGEGRDAAPARIHVLPVAARAEVPRPKSGSGLAQRLDAFQHDGEASRNFRRVGRKATAAAR